MERTLLKEEIKEIQMPAAMQARILENCRTAEEKEIADMSKKDRENTDIYTNDGYEQAVDKKRNRRSNKWTRIATAAAAVAVCLGLGGITVMAASGKLEGFFADVTRWDGAVVGTTYEQATEEIEVSVSVSGDRLIVDAVLLKADEAPYAYLDSLGVQAYSIEDGDGNVVVEGISYESGSITDGKVSMTLPLDELEGGTYKLIITEFVGAKKAEQDLPVKGYWECDFVL